MEEAIDSLNLFVITAVMVFQLDPIVEFTVRKVFRKFNFHNLPGLLLFWVFSRDPGSNLILTNITCNPTQDQGLEDYRNRCFENEYPSVKIPTSVGNWSAGRSAQTGIADHKTTHHVVEQQDQYSEDVGARGQLVFPVYYLHGAVNELVGVIEYVTPLPKESYVDDFGQFRNLLEEEGLTSTYIGKTVKVVYNNNTVRFPLPLEAEFRDLHMEVTMRFPELNNQEYRVEYINTEGIRLPILTDDDLHVCLGESSSRGIKFTRMFISVEHRGEATKGLIRKSYAILSSELLQA